MMTSDDKQKVFVTHDLSLAAYLLMKGMVLFCQQLERTRVYGWMNGREEVPKW